METDAWIDFDIEKVKQLYEEYATGVDFVLSGLDLDVRWNSPLRVKIYFKNTFDISLDNVKIAHVLSHLETVDHDSPAFDALNGYVLYLKYTYTLKNYINCILRYENEGRICLRSVDGVLKMPNGRPLSSSPEILKCVTAQNL
jgi:hypothetical protein